MAYHYETERPWLFTDEGQRTLLKVRDHMQRLFATAGACTVEKAMGGATGNTFQLLACIDRLGEMGEIIRLQRDGMSQHQVPVPRVIA